MFVEMRAMSTPVESSLSRVATSLERPAAGSIFVAKHAAGHGNR
jgi:hypothetical protein